jgi:hypothetical protein
MLPILSEALLAHREDQNKSRKAFDDDYRADLDLIIARPDGSPGSRTASQQLMRASQKKSG